MSRNNDRGIAYIVCLAILMTAGFATTAYSQQSKPKAAPLPKYSRDWTTVVQKIVRTFDANRMMKIGKQAGLRTKLCSRSASVKMLFLSLPARGFQIAQPTKRIVRTSHSVSPTV